MTYPETVEYLYHELPMYQKVGALAYKKDLANTIRLCKVLGNPETRFKSVHIAGTNGKGSSAHMLAAILQCAGLRTGLYTSPHLKSFSERIRLNGQEIAQDFVIDFVERIRPWIHEISPSFFEITVAMAFDYFAREKVDVSVIETGLGGRLDSTNVITPLVSLITNIDFDHKDILGDTLNLIAYEKAGIIKPKVPIVVSEYQPEVEDVFITKARDCSSALTFASKEISVEENDGYVVYQRGKMLVDGLKPDLTGYYQHKNMKGVLAVIERLRELGFTISNEHIREGINHTASLTGLKGRWQTLSVDPLMICDTAHNAHGIKDVVHQIRKLTFKKLHFVFGMVKDKDPDPVLNLLPKEAHYYFCQAKISRAQDAQEISHLAGQFGLMGEVIPDVQEAVARAKECASSDDLIFIGGSTFVVAEIEEL